MMKTRTLAIMGVAICVGALGVPLIDPHTIPLIDPHTIPLIDPHTIPLIDPH